MYISIYILFILFVPITHEGLEASLLNIQVWLNQQNRGIELKNSFGEKVGFILAGAKLISFNKLASGLFWYCNHQLKGN